MGSPPCLYLSTVDPFTVMMSSLPSLSQSMRPAPPLIDSTMYFLSGEEMCGTVRAAFAAMSSNWGTILDASAGGACALEPAAWPRVTAATNNPIHKNKKKRVRINSGDLDYTDPNILWRS